MGMAISASLARLSLLPEGTDRGVRQGLGQLSFANSDASYGSAITKNGQHLIPPPPPHKDLEKSLW